MTEDKREASKLRGISTTILDQIQQENEILLQQELPPMPEDLKSGIFTAIEQEEKKMRKERIKHKFVQNSWKAAAILILCFLLVGTALVPANAIKEIVLSLFTHNETKEFIELQPKEEGTMIKELKAALPEWNDYYYPKFIPAGYQLSAEDCRMVKADKTIVFKKQGTELFLIQNSCEDNGASLKLDNEESFVKDMMVGSSAAILSVKEERYTLAWTSHQTLFQLIGILDEATLGQIADSLRYIK